MAIHLKKIIITPKKLSGSITVPASKSVCHRAIICAALSNGISKISNVSFSDDINATLEAMTAFGANIQKDGSTLLIDGSNTFKNPQNLTLNCKESGSTLRFMVPLALHNREETTFIGSQRLSQRPLDEYFTIFDKHGVKYTTENYLPLVMQGKPIGGKITLGGNVSSQYVSGLLFALPLFPGDSEIHMSSPLQSRGYVDITIDILEKFGIKIENKDYRCFHIKGGQGYTPCDYRCEGDFSQAAFFLVAGCLGSGITCNGLNLKSRQGDIEILNILRDMGANIQIDGDNITCAPSKTHGIIIDAEQIPDLVPILAVLTSFSEGGGRIINASRLRIKESDRLHSISSQLNLLGATVIEQPDGLIIEGDAHLTGGEVDCCNDHRIAMSLAVAASRASEQVTLMGSDCVSKSYPAFWQDYVSVGGVVHE